MNVRSHLNPGQFECCCFFPISNWFKYILLMKLPKSGVCLCEVALQKFSKRLKCERFIEKKNQFDWKPMPEPAKKTKKINGNRIGLMRWTFKMNWNSLVISQQNWLINETVRICRKYICISLLLMTNTNFRAVSCTRCVPQFFPARSDNMKYFNNAFGHCFHLQMVSI